MKNIAGLLLALSCFTSVFSQSVHEFDSLKKKAYSSYDNRDYATSLTYFEKLIQLSEKIGSALGADVYYDIACNYSLNKKATQALHFLQRSFEVSNATNRTNTVSASHLTTDPDLDLIRTQPGFLALSKKYYSGSDYELISLMAAKEISYADLLKLIDLLSKKASIYTLRITDKMIYWKKSGDSLLFNEASLTMPNFEAFQGRRLDFLRCTFNLNFVWDGRSNKICDQFTFSDCHFAGRFMFYELKFRNPPQFIRCVFDKSLLIFSHSELIEGGPSQPFMLDKCSLHYVQVRLLVQNAVDVIITGNHTNGDSAKIGIVCDDVSTSVIQNNSMATNDFEIRFENVETLTVSENKFRNLMIMSTNVAAEFSLQNLDMTGKIFFNRTYFSSDPANDIQWTALKNNKIALSLNRFTGGSDFSPNGTVIFRPLPIQFISGEKREDISNDQYFSKLMGLYSMFLNLYKSKNDIESYNACFVQIKEFQSSRLKYLYESNPSFERYFRWKLSQLLKFYVRYGTDPARAIVISIYIIVCFGIFFFFFPSDWDVTSKTRLITNFKDFIQKNEKGYVKPFFVLAGGFMISLINAVTLSLNAFITLGFGNIPTHGIARYFCVLEGFLGWFLLSIFTVAMINQVL